ncbi:MAG: ribosome recycling factor [Anaerohalosphaeraceae bacterium]
MTTKQIVAEHERNMHKSIDFLKTELRSVRTGRASPGLVEHLTVEYYGTPTPLKQLATIAVPDPSSIVIKPFDVSCLKEIEKAIKASELSLAPVADGKTIRLNLPPLSEERRKQIVQQVKQMGEKVKVTIRNIRRDAIKALEDEEKKKTITEDDRDRGKKEIEDLTKKHIEQIDEIIEAKSREILSE